MSSKKERNSKDSSPVSSPVQSSMPSQSSPTIYSRINEKKELANLNDRLACYIDRVRNLENENERLTREVKTSQETICSKVSNVKTIYENELSGTRKLLDEISREKAKLEIDAARLVGENEELRENLIKKANECTSLQAKFSLIENHISELSNKYNLTCQEQIKLREENRNLKEEENKLNLMNSNLKKNLEEEVLRRVSLQNTVQTVREEFAFKEQVLLEQLTEYRNKIEETTVNGQMSQVYEERFYESLQEIRDQYEIDLENNKKEIKKLYEEKIRSLEAQLNRNNSTSSIALEEMKQMQIKLDNGNNRLAAAEEERNIANQKARDLMRELEMLKSGHMNEIAKHNLEMTQLKEEMMYQIQKYEELMDEKVALDLEIAAYGKLLEGEETRLNLSSVSNLSNRSARSAKRKRSCIEKNDESTSTSSFSMNTTTKGDIELAEIDVGGKFIRLKNKGNKEISLSGWHLVQTADDKGNNISFKFNRTVKINQGGTITVWSSNTDQMHRPPVNIVMKHQNWLIADKVTTSLINDSGEIIATTDHLKHVLSTSTSTQKNDVDINGERCSIM